MTVLDLCNLLSTSSVCRLHIRDKEAIGSNDVNMESAEEISSLNHTWFCPLLDFRLHQDTPTNFLQNLIKMDPAISLMLFLGIVDLVSVRHCCRATFFLHLVGFPRAICLVELCVCRICA